MPEVIMPKMGDAMEAGTLSSWLKHEGDQVEVGDVLAEIETDRPRWSWRPRTPAY